MHIELSISNRLASGVALGILGAVIAIKKKDVLASGFDVICSRVKTKVLGTFGLQVKEDA